MKHLAPFLILLLFTLHVSSQKMWGKVDPAQFAVRQCPFDTSASAMILDDSVSITFHLNDVRAFCVTYNYYRRIQILRKEGFKRGSVQIQYYTSTNKNPITMIEAQTLNLNEAGKVQVTKIKDKAIYDERLSEWWSAKNFAFPDVREGSIIEYRYTEESPNTYHLHDWWFQNEMPVINSAVMMRSPNLFHYTQLLLGHLKISKNESKGYEDLDGDIMYRGKETHVVMENIPALKPEAFTTTEKDYATRLMFVLAGFTDALGKTTVYTDSWNTVGQKLMENENFGMQISTPGPYQKMARKLAGNSSDTLEIIKNIYNYVSNTIRWNKKYYLYTKNTPAKTWSDSTGNSSDITLLLINMLRSVGVQADPVLISTRDNGKITKAYPNEKQFNSSLAMIDVAGEQVLLDANNWKRPYNLIAENDLNYLGLRITKVHATPEDTFKTTWVHLRPPANSTKRLYIQSNIDTSGSLKFDFKLTASDYYALSYRHERGLDAKGRLKPLVNIGGDIDITEPKVENADDLSQPVELTFSGEKKSEPAQNGLIYINPFPIRFYSDNPLTLSERVNPVNFTYPSKKFITSTITVPENYKIAELPKSVNVMLDDSSASFIFTVYHDEGKIQITSSLKINDAEYDTEVYPALKALFAKMIDAYNSTIVLEKK